MRRKVLFNCFFILILLFGIVLNVDVVEADAYQDFVDEFAPDGKMVVNSVMPTSIRDAMAYFTYYINYVTHGGLKKYMYSSISRVDNDNNQNFNGIYEIKFCEYKIVDGVKVCEVIDKVESIDVTFDDSKKDLALASQVSNYIENFERGKQYHIWSDDPYEVVIKMDDMELLSYMSKEHVIYTGLNSVLSLLRYNDTFRDITGNINFAYPWLPGGNGSELHSSLKNSVLFEYDGFIYGNSPSTIREIILNAVYIDESVGDDVNSVMVAVQNRLDDNFGKNVATISLIDSTDFDVILDEIVDEYMTPYEIAIDKNNVVNQLFNINIGGYDYKFFVIKDSSKIKNLTNVKTVDFKTFSSIVFNSKYVSADAMINITQNDDNASILNTLNLDSGITYDISLFSDLLGSCIDRLDNGTFMVSVPISNQMLGKRLFAYYIKQDGSIERHRVTIKDGFATFETNHFSEYTIGEATGVELKIKKVANGNNELQLENGKYVLNSIQAGGIDIFYQLVNIDKDYVVVLKNDSGIVSNYTYYYGMDYNNFYINIDKNMANYKLQVCDTYQCQEVYDEININFDYQIPDFVNDVRVVVSNVKQANVLLDGVHYAANTSVVDSFGFYHQFKSDTTLYLANDMQTISMNVKAYNLVPEDEYMINDSTYTGEELMDGIVYTYKPNFVVGNVELKLTKKYAFIAKMMDVNNDLIEIYLHDDESLNDYDYELNYHNYKNQKVNTTWEKFVVLNRNYLDINNPLDITIKGTSNYLNQDYNVNIRISDNNQEVYYKEISVNGLLLNDGYTITLDGLELDYVKFINMYEIEKEYTVDISVDYVIHTFQTIYNSLGNVGKLFGKIYYRNGEQNLTATNGGGALRSSGENYYVNDNLFIKYPHIYLNYRSREADYDDNLTYSYELIYGEMVYDEYGMSESRHAETIKTGTISGKTLNSTGIVFEVDNHGNYRNPYYSLYVKYGDEAIYIKQLSIKQTTKPMINSGRLVSKNRDLFLVVSNDTFVTSYVATRNTPNKVILSGLGLDADKEYELDVYYSFSDKRITGDNKVVVQYHEVVRLLGRDINNGAAIIENKYVTDKEYTDEYIAIMSDELFDVGINIEYVDCRNLIRTINTYTLDNTKDIIKRIRKNTMVQDFINNFEILNGGKLKIFDSNGMSEVLNKIGTGMLARIINELDENILDLDVVVTGDINGDGNISVTDLAKLERHIAKLNELDGVYEMAADVNDNGTVTLTDLTKIVRDIAKLEEIE